MCPLLLTNAGSGVRVHGVQDADADQPDVGWTDVSILPIPKIAFDASKYMATAEDEDKIQRLIDSLADVDGAYDGPFSSTGGAYFSPTGFDPCISEARCCVARPGSRFVARELA